jgi:hypothetical protein
MLQSKQVCVTASELIQQFHASLSQVPSNFPAEKAYSWDSVPIERVDVADL